MRSSKVTHALMRNEKDLNIPFSSVAFSTAERATHVLNYADSGRISRKRIETLFEKEPGTIAWLDSFSESDTLVDVGANVGMYSVYAASVRGTRVFAFEPEALNYADLNKNIYLNGLHDKVTAFCLAMSDEFNVDRLYLSSFVPGFSHHDFGERRWEGPVTKLAKSAEDRIPQGCVAMAMDDLVWHGQIPYPTHVKIDVDGFEYKVVLGMLKYVLPSPKLKTVLVEIDYTLDKNVAIIEQMAALGWRYSLDQVCWDRDGQVSKEEWQRRLATKSGGNNVIFFKDDFYTDYFRQKAKEAT